MRISIIIAVYKDLEALKLIVSALRLQSYPDLEIVIAEDNNDKAMAEYISTLSDLNIVHTTQEDLGIRKARSQNNAILKCTGEYLIFIDGDCIPYSTFINAHASLAEPGCVLSGRRVNLGEGISKKIRNGTIDPLSIESNFLTRSLQLFIDGATHITQGIYISPKNWIYRNIILKRKKSNLNILGCNFSCYKKDLINIDGFDEAYGETAVPDDTDLQWRLETAGLRLKSCKMAANQFHLEHSRSHQVMDTAGMIQKMLRRKEAGNYIAEIGLSSHKDYIHSAEKQNAKRHNDAKRYDVSVILINFNSSKHTIKCVDSIIRNTNSALTYNIVIVDNASSRDDFLALTDTPSLKNDKISIIRSKVNLGFSTGNMLGILHSSADYYFLLNNDCILQNDCLGILHSFSENNAHVALCSPQLVNRAGEPQPCINYFPTLKTKIFGSGILSLSYGHTHTNRKETYNRPVPVDVVSGSQMFLRAESLFGIGGLDTTFFLYCEEEDLALRLNKSGYKTYLIPQAINFHHGSGSTDKSLAIKKEFYISFLYFYRKHYGFIDTQIIKLITSLRLFRKLFQSKDNLSLAIFVIKGAHLKYSLRHTQTIIDDDFTYEYSQKQACDTQLKEKTHPVKTP